MKVTFAEAPGVRPVMLKTYQPSGAETPVGAPEGVLTTEALPSVPALAESVTAPPGLLKVTGVPPEDEPPLEDEELLLVEEPPELLELLVELPLEDPELLVEEPPEEELEEEPPVAHFVAMLEVKPREASPVNWPIADVPLDRRAKPVQWPALSKTAPPPPPSDAPAGRTIELTATAPKSCAGVVAGALDEVGKFSTNSSRSCAGVDEAKLMVKSPAVPAAEVLCRMRPSPATPTHE